LESDSDHRLPYPFSHACAGVVGQQVCRLRSTSILASPAIFPAPETRGCKAPTVRCICAPNAAYAALTGRGAMKKTRFTEDGMDVPRIDD